MVQYSQITAVSTRALPARAAPLSGWTHRLRPRALHACPCTQKPHSAQNPVTLRALYSTCSQVPRGYSTVYSLVYAGALTASAAGLLIMRNRYKSKAHEEKWYWQNRQLIC
jgi:hypothetical protein